MVRVISYLMMFAARVFFVGGGGYGPLKFTDGSRDILVMFVAFVCLGKSQSRGDSCFDRHSRRTVTIFSFPARFRYEIETKEADAIDYLRSMSYKSYAAQESVRNGLGSGDNKVLFKNWIGDPPPK